MVLSALGRCPSWTPILSVVPGESGDGILRVDDEKNRAEAERIERENPGWIVVFGVYTGQFVCFPRFSSPRGTVLVARYPGALPARMRKAERRFLPKDG